MELVRLFGTAEDENEWMRYEPYRQFKLMLPSMARVLGWRACRCAAQPPKSPRYGVTN
jgi:hypothetical protein